MKVPGRSLLPALAAVSGLALGNDAFAFERCEGIVSGAGPLAQRVGERVIYDAPVPQFDVALSVEFRHTAPLKVLLPLADVTENGDRVVFFPDRFGVFACQVVLAHYLENEGVENVWDAGFETVRDCLAEGHARAYCLTRFGAKLQQTLAPAFARVPSGHQGTAYAIALDAIFQVGAHELAHHLFDHFDRIESGDIPRVDAEFEADFYAIQWAIEDGRAYSALAYLSRAMEVVDAAAATASDKAPGPSDASYESWSCRYHNVERSISAFSGAPFVFREVMLNHRAANAAGQTLAEQLSWAIDDLSNADPVAAAPEGCSRLGTQVLKEARQEMLGIMRAYQAHRDVFIVVPDMTDGTFEPLASGASVDALEAIAGQMRRSRHLRTLTSGVVSFTVQRAGHTNGLQLPDEWLFGLRSDLAQRASGRNYGRFLNGLAARYLEFVSTPEGRSVLKPLYEESSRYLPDSTDTWANLGLIAMYERDCRKAIEYLDLSVEFANPGPAQEFAESTRDFFRQAARQQPEKCDTLP